MIGQYDVEITRVWQDDKVEGIDAKNGIFLILEMNIYNYSDDELCLIKGNFTAYQGEKGIIPERMYQVNKEHKLNRTYPGTSRLNRQCVPNSRVWETFISYDISENPELIRINFNLTTAASAEIEIWLVRNEDSRDYSFAIAEVDNEALISIGKIRFSEETIETVLDAERGQVENCNASNRATTISLSREYTRSNQIDNKFKFDANGVVSPLGGETTKEFIRRLRIPIPLSFFEASVNAEYSRISTNQESETLIFSRDETIGADSGTIANYEITWMLVAQAGYVEVTANGQTYEIPFAVEHAIRADVKTLPPEDCPETTE